MTASGWAATAAWIMLLPTAGGVLKTWIRAGQADGRAQRAEERAEEAIEAYHRIGDALDRMSGVLPTDPGTPVEFVIEHRKGSLYALRNLGPQDATGVKVVDLPEQLVVRTMPDGQELLKMQSHDMLMAGSSAARLPSELKVTCDQLDSPVFVPVPRKY